MDKLILQKLKDMFGSLNNIKRIKIILLCNKNGFTITELSKKLNLNYNITSEYVSSLAKAGLVEKIRNSDRTVTVKSLIKIEDNGEIRRVD